MSAYKVSLQVHNMGDNDVDIKWKEGKSNQRMRVKKNLVAYRDIVIRSIYRPGPIKFLATRSNSNQREKINGLDFISIQPIKDDITFGVFNILPEGMHFHRS